MSEYMAGYELAVTLVTLVILAVGLIFKSINDKNDDDDDWFNGGGWGC